MENLIPYESLNEKDGKMSPKEAYDFIVALCKDPKMSKACLDNIMKYQTTSAQDQVDKAVYLLFVKSIQDKKPIGPVDYIGQRLVANPKILNMIVNMSPEKMKSFKFVNEGFWSSLFGKPTVADAAHSAMKAQGFSHRGSEQDNYIMFNGQKFYPEQIEFDEVSSTKPIPRIENGILIVANPAWSL